LSEGIMRRGIIDVFNKLFITFALLKFNILNNTLSS